jgi:acyl carrier protein
MSRVDLETVQRALHDFVVGEVLFRSAPLRPDEDLFAAGFDSMSLARVLVFVEERFGVVIPDQDVVVDEVSTLEGMARFVHGRLHAGA